MLDHKDYKHNQKSLEQILPKLVVLCKHSKGSSFLCLCFLRNTKWKFYISLSVQKNLRNTQCTIALFRSIMNIFEIS